MIKLFDNKFDDYIIIIIIILIVVMIMKCHYENFIENYDNYEKKRQEPIFLKSYSELTEGLRKSFIESIMPPVHKYLECLKKNDLTDKCLDKSSMQFYKNLNKTDKTDLNHKIAKGFVNLNSNNQLDFEHIDKFLLNLK